jgi:hypothetical protein
MTCPRCKKAYADGKPDDFASEPECAFKTEVFDPSNWQCQTMNELREIAEEKASYASDHGASDARRAENRLVTPLTLEIAERALKE